MTFANEELIALCRTVIGAIQESDGFDRQQLRRLILRIVPPLLAEIDILESALSSVLEAPGARAVVVDAQHETAAPQKRRRKRRRRK